MLPKRRSLILLQSVLLIVAVISCSALTSSTSVAYEAATAPVTSPTGSIAEMPEVSQTPSPHPSAAALPCPIDDESFCDFVYELQPIVEDSDIEGILARTRQYDCATSGGFHPGWNPEFECSEDSYCVQSGVFEGEGGCTPLSSVRSTWNSNAHRPLILRGIVYPLIPGLDQYGIDELSGPAILVRTDEPEWDWILFCKPADGKWSISAILRQRRSAAQYQTPEDVVVPWH
jgi:hypothetical protein